MSMLLYIIWCVFVCSVCGFPGSGCSVSGVQGVKASTGTAQDRLPRALPRTGSHGQEASTGTAQHRVLAFRFEVPGWRM
jgi:hypothetical protein